MQINPFLPDLPVPQNEAPTVTPLAPSGTPAGEVPTFRDQVLGLIKDVNDKIVTSDQNVRDLAMGKTNDLDKVVASVEEANLALQYTVAIRGKLVDAYQEIARTQM
jgi:flagellar hook-basal body complex protein FliE